ncbi:hypothetical protein ANCCAN_18148 [Ancylostoma caninum]|uniref:C-type lectin domain-containing protein n=1 Tax=Ancylostoma caninum TaxID=29170 RepID=A0A368G074_ANCCA|nr:hypothetical protein ANCCAN_18148 [Ancylostoma caninum]
MEVGVWIGYKRVTKHKRPFAWVDGTPSKFESWKRGEPNNANGYEDCTYVSLSSQI